MSNISRVKLKSPIKNDKRTFNATDDAAYIAMKDYFKEQGYRTTKTKDSSPVDLIVTNELNPKKAYSVELKVERGSDEWYTVMLKKNKILSMERSGYNNIIICFCFDISNTIYSISLENFKKHAKFKKISFKKTDCDDSELEEQEVFVISKKYCKKSHYDFQEKYNQALVNSAFKYQISSFIVDI